MRKCYWYPKVACTCPRRFHPSTEMTAKRCERYLRKDAKASA